MAAARERQTRRFAGSERVRASAGMGPAEARRCCDADAIVQPLQNFPRAFYRILKLARTIADLAGAPLSEGNGVRGAEAAN